MGSPGANFSLIVRKDFYERCFFALSKSFFTSNFYAFYTFIYAQEICDFQSEFVNDATTAIYSINSRKPVYAIFTMQRVTLGSWNILPSMRGEFIEFHHLRRSMRLPFWGKIAHWLEFTLQFVFLFLSLQMEICFLSYISIKCPLPGL